MSDPQLATPEPLDLHDPAGSRSEDAAGTHAIVRQTIVDAKRAVIGYELFEVPAASSNTDAMLFDAGVERAPPPGRPDAGWCWCAARSSTSKATTWSC